MRKRVQIALAVLVVAVAGVIAWEMTKRREPVYQGRALTAWLEQYSVADNLTPVTEEKTATMDQAGDAIRQIGTEAVPILVEMARAKDSLLKRIITIIARHQKIVRVHLKTANERRQMAVFGFYALGSAGKDAVPALVDLVKNEDPDVRLNAADCLGNIGPDAREAVALLLPYVNSTNRIVAWDATVNLGRIHMEAPLVVPVLVGNLSATNISMRYRGTTIDALGRFGGQAKSAIPFIIPFLTDPDEDNRSAATNALKAIDPQAAVRAGVK